MFQSTPPNVSLADIRKTPGRADEMIEILFAALHESARDTSGHLFCAVEYPLLRITRTLALEAV
jgi:hypothetical protein